MKKKMFFVCLLAVLVFGLAGSVRASETGIMESKIKTQADVLNFFKKAMDNRYGNLNSNRQTGSQGVSTYILGNRTPGSIKISTSTLINSGIVSPQATAITQLDWFKAEFLKNTDGVLTTGNKEGIKQAMTARYTDICVAEWNTAIKALTKAYNTAVANARKTRVGVKVKAATATAPAILATGEELCKFNYNRDIKDLAIVPAKNSNYDNATLKFIALQKLQDTKDQCVNDTYTQLYVAKVAALNAFTAGKTTADSSYNNCIDGTRAGANAAGDRINYWQWAR